MGTFRKNQQPQSMRKRGLAPIDVFEQEDGRPADLIGGVSRPIEPAPRSAVTIHELFGDEEKLPARLREGIKAVHKARLTCEVEVEEIQL